MDLQTTLNKLYSLHQFGIKLGLDNITSFLEMLGNPHDKFKSFHIAGSNGKGSTASFIASLLMESGYKTGLYTSPHFVRFNERVRANGIQIPDNYILDFISANTKYIDEKELTFFEVTTGMAFKYFADAGVDYAVIETGLGGRLDATNTISPLASAITTISKEHTEILGDTLEKIAFEKAGIIKPDSNVFAGIMPNEAYDVINRTAAERNCKKYFLKDFMEERDDSVRIRLLNNKYTIYSTPLPGKHQFYNAALAVKTFSTILGIEDQVILNRGIKNVISNSGIQGRYEVYREMPRIIFDSAHNPDGVRIFLNEFKKIYRKFPRRSLVFTALKDKAVVEMISLLAPFFTDFFVTTVNNDRALSIEEILKMCRSMGIKGKPLPEPEILIKEFEKGKKGDCLVVLGSMYLLGEVKEKIGNTLDN